MYRHRLLAALACATALSVAACQAQDQRQHRGGASASANAPSDYEPVPDLCEDQGDVPDDGTRVERNRKGWTLTVWSKGQSGPITYVSPFDVDVADAAKAELAIERSSIVDGALIGIADHRSFQSMLVALSFWGSAPTSWHPGFDLEPSMNPTARGIASLTALQRLERLSISHAVLGRAELSALGTLPKIRELRLVHCGVDGLALGTLAGLPLETLTLTDCWIPNDGPIDLTELSPTLRALDMTYDVRLWDSTWGVQDGRGRVAIAGPHLEWLGLRGWRLGVADLTAIASGLPSLQAIELTSRLYDVAEVAAALPGITVIATERN